MASQILREDDNDYANYTILTLRYSILSQQKQFTKTISVSVFLHLSSLTL